MCTIVSEKAAAADTPLGSIVGICMGTGVLVAAARIGRVGDRVGVRVAVEVGDGVLVGRDVAVAVGVWVRVGVAVAVAVGVTNHAAIVRRGRGSNSATPPPLQINPSSTTPRANHLF